MLLNILDNDCAILLMLSNKGINWKMKYICNKCFFFKYLLQGYVIFSKKISSYNVSVFMITLTVELKDWKCEY